MPQIADYIRLVDGRFELFATDDGISGAIIDGALRTDLNWVVAGEAALKCKIQLCGHGTYAFDDGETHTLQGEALVFAHQPPDSRKREIIPRDVRERSIIFAFPFSKDRGVAGCDPETAAVERAVRFLSGRRLFHQRNVPRVAQDCVAAVLDPRVSASTRRKFTGAKLDELACLVLDTFLAEFDVTSRRALSERELRRVREARDLLVNHLADPPILPQLARTIGINRTKLTLGFQQLYGMSMFQILRQERMRLARSLLEERQLGISEVADLCGYGHASNFSLAYKAYYGMPPSWACTGRKSLP